MVPNIGLHAEDLVVKRQTLSNPQLMGKEETLDTQTNRTLLQNIVILWGKYTR